MQNWTNTASHVIEPAYAIGLWILVQNLQVKLTSYLYYKS